MVLKLAKPVCHAYQRKHSICQGARKWPCFFTCMASSVLVQGLWAKRGGLLHSDPCERFCALLGSYCPEERRENPAGPIQVLPKCCQLHSRNNPTLAAKSLQPGGLSVLCLTKSPSSEAGQGGRWWATSGGFETWSIQARIHKTYSFFCSFILAIGEVPNIQNGSYHFKSARITYKWPQCIRLYLVNKTSISIVHAS